MSRSYLFYNLLGNLFGMVKTEKHLRIFLMLVKLVKVFRKFIITSLLRKLPFIILSLYLIRKLLQPFIIL